MSLSSPSSSGTSSVTKDWGCFFCAPSSLPSVSRLALVEKKSLLVSVPRARNEEEHFRSELPLVVKARAAIVAMIFIKRGGGQGRGQGTG